MHEFTKLCWRLDSSNKTSDKLAALKDYFAIARSEDAAWAVYFLAGRRIKRLVPTKLLRQWARESASLSEWLFNECYDRVGDLAETISLIVPANEQPAEIPLREIVEDRLMPLRDASEVQQREMVQSLWRQLDSRQLFVVGKLMTGAFRMGVSARLLQRGLAELHSLEVPTVAHRMTGDWLPTVEFYDGLISKETQEEPTSKPYPFFLANPIKEDPSDLLGDVSQWCAEWKWDGIRAQFIKRADEVFLWSRGEDLITEQYPELQTVAERLPNGTVIDGELVAWDYDANRPQSFGQLQRRLGRKRVGKKLLSEVPVVLLAFDLLEHEGKDFRSKPLERRKAALSDVLYRSGLTDLCTDKLRGGGDEPNAGGTPTSIWVPPAVMGDSWDELAEQREQSKANRAEGLMLKRRGSTYQVNRPVGDWWKWKVDPFTIDAVLIYAQRGHGRRASLYTDYTFAVWDEQELVPFAKAYSGLTDAEIRRVDNFVRRNTKERFGPVRSVEPRLVFELAFENIQRSTRHKSGVAVRFPRISRWREDKSAQEADRLQTILDLLESE